MVKNNIQTNATYYIAYGKRICLLLIYVASGPITSWQIDGEKAETATDIIFLGSLQMVTVAMKLKDALLFWKKSYDQPR